MSEERDSEQPRLAKLGILVALALAGQFVARSIASRYVTNLGAPAQRITVAIDVILLAFVPIGFFLAPTLSLPGMPFLDRLIHRDRLAHEFNRAVYRSLVLALISFVAGQIALTLPIARNLTVGVSAPIPLPLAILLSVAAAFREEIEFRFGLLTLLAWLVDRPMRMVSAESRSIALWIANFGQAIIFGALHQIAGFTARTSAPSLIGALLDPRTIIGLVFGYGYIRFGLETAIMTHALADSAIFVMAATFSR